MKTAAKQSLHESEKMTPLGSKLPTNSAEEPKRLADPKTLGAAVRLVARLGGYVGRRKEPPPGHEVIWRGQAQLMTLCEGFALGKDSIGSTNYG